MDYAMDILKEKAYKLERSKDNLRDTFERAKSQIEAAEDEETVKMLQELIEGYPTERREISDRLDSLYEAISYLSKRGDDS